VAVPFTIPKLPGTFFERHLKNARWSISRMTGQMPHIRCFEMEVPDGILRVMLGREPFNNPEDWSESNLAWHLSISHAHFYKDSKSWGFERCPTWEEMKHAKYSLCPSEVEMSICFPPASDRWIDNAPTCLHLWEERR